MVRLERPLMARIVFVQELPREMRIVLGLLRLREIGNQILTHPIIYLVRSGNVREVNQ
jgi:hypothetical protein